MAGRGGRDHPVALIALKDAPQLAKRNHVALMAKLQQHLKRDLTLEGRMGNGDARRIKPGQREGFSDGPIDADMLKIEHATVAVRHETLDVGWKWLGEIAPSGQVARWQREPGDELKHEPKACAGVQRPNAPDRFIWQQAIIGMGASVDESR